MSGPRNILRKPFLRSQPNNIGILGIFATYCINNQLTFLIDVYTVCVTDAVANYLARLYSHNYIDDCPILVLSEYRTFTTSEKQLANKKKLKFSIKIQSYFAMVYRAKTLLSILLHVSRVLD